MKLKETIIIAILILGLLGLYSLDRGRLGHSIPDEKRYMQSTKEMVESGDYITPRYHGRLRFQKPILFYWFILLSYKFFGIGIFGARFPSIVAALAIYWAETCLIKKRAYFQRLLFRQVRYILCILVLPLPIWYFFCLLPHPSISL